MRNKYLHHLPKLWHEFKKVVPDSNLEEFNATVNKLHAFEDIRYPDRVARQGMASIIGIKPRDPIASKGVRNEPFYEISVEEVDTLIKYIFEKASINPLYFTNGLNKDAQEYLQKWNDTGITDHQS